MADDQHAECRAQSQEHKAVFIVKVVWVGYQQGVGVVKGRLCLLKRYAMLFLLAAALFLSQSNFMESSLMYLQYMYNRMFVNAFCGVQKVTIRFYDNTGAMLLRCLTKY
jgi:hypothetical protein